MRSFLIKFIVVCMTTVGFLACNELHPDGYVLYGLYKFQKGVVNIPLVDTHRAANAMITRIPTEKVQTAYAVTTLTRVNLTSTASGVVAANLSVEQNDVKTLAQNAPSPFMPPSKYLPMIEEIGKSNPTYKAATVPRNVFDRGDIWTGVRVEDVKNEVFRTVNAVCLAVGQYSYLMLEIKKDTNLADLDALLDPLLVNSYISNFDRDYLRMHEYFAVEKDIDANGKVIIMMYDMNEKDLYGMFYPKDKWATTANTNNADIVYVNSTLASKSDGAQMTSAILVHELQHMIYYDNLQPLISTAAMNDSTWFNEAMSMLAMYRLGYYRDGTDQYINGFRTGGYNGLSLTNWTDSNYGFSMLFGVYMYEQYGEVGIKNVYKIPFAGLHAVEKITNRDFNKVFAEFVTAVAVSKRGYNEREYNFRGIDFRRYTGGGEDNLVPTTTIAAGASFETKIPFYSIFMAKITGSSQQIKMTDVFDGKVFLSR